PSVPASIETARLLLRRFTAADGGLLFDLDSDPEVMRYLTGGAGTPRALIEARVLPRFLEDRGDFAGSGAWALIEKAGARFVGWVSLRPLDAAAGAAELGYRLRRESWGRGYAAEAARILLRTAFAAPSGPARVLARTYQDNLASRRVLEKLGMTLVRT